LVFHGLAMSGGVLDAVERTSADLSRVEDAYRWLGLWQIAVLLESVRHEIAAGALDLAAGPPLLAWRLPAAVGMVGRRR
jgi:hypothetical protein